MQIRLTVLAAPPGGQTARRACDVLVTAPAGTALAAVASGVAAAVAGPDGAAGTGPVVLYAGRERLDPQRCALGEPPLVDGAVLALQVPAEGAAVPDGAVARLHVVAGPDAGGVHLLHPGRVRVGRSADADVPLDDPDVSRLHCELAVGDDGRATVADPGSTNGTTLDGRPVGPRPVRLPAGALLRVGESALRLTAGAGASAPLPTAPDGEGHVRVARVDPPVSPGAPGDEGARSAHGSAGGTPAATGAAGPAGAPARGPRAGADRDGFRDGGRGTTGAGTGTAPGLRRAGADPAPDGPDGASGGHGAPGGHGGGPDGLGAHAGGPAPRAGAHLPPARTDGGDGARTGGSGPAREGGPSDAAPAPTDPRFGAAAAYDRAAPYAESSDGPAPHHGGAPVGGSARDGAEPHGAPAQHGTAGPGAYDGMARDQGGAGGTPARGTRLPEPPARRRGIGAWARRLTGARGDQPAPGPGGPQGAAGAPGAPAGAGADAWPDPAAVLLTALGPGARLWERTHGHPEALAVRLGTTDREGLAAVPVTVGLREAGSLGLAGPRPRLLGLARSVVAQVTALHAPADLEVVLVCADRARPLEERRRDWGWLGWLPHVRPAHGQDCRLLLAYDRDQAAARAAELTRRLDDGPLGPGWAEADHRAVAEAAERFRRDHLSGVGSGTYTVVVVDGDPGTAELRETVARLAGVGAAAGIHLVCLAETAPATAVFPAAAAYEAACAAAPAFRECGAVGLLTGDVASALRVMRTAGGHPAGHGTVAAVDAVSPAWAERFARALAPLRADGTERRGRAAVALPRSSRLLDELELARATPASLMARWATAPDGTAVLGSGPHGPLSVDLTGPDGPHLLVEGPAGSGRTELLRSVAASLAASSRPDRLALLLVDGAGGERGDGLAPCTDLPHVVDHLAASDPVRMRAFAQALGSELKRRAELLGRDGFPGAYGEQPDHAIVGRPAREGDRPTWDSGRAAREVVPEQRGGALDPAVGRTPRPRPAAVAPVGAAARTPAGPAVGTAGRAGGREAPPPRLVVLVDDLDALVAPALGSPGRPAAGSVVRALEAVARDGERLGVHLVVSTAHPDRTAGTEPDRRARTRVVLDVPPGSPGPDDPAPGRGRLCGADGRSTPFQAGRVTGRIPRTATLRPTVVPLEWERMGDPPARRPVRELGNGPTDLALLASALDRAARSVGAEPVPPLAPVSGTDGPVSGTAGPVSGTAGPVR
ncbi:FtsK/SpoIIIE domain-containing protein [Streptomyces fradiae]|uniref:FtsK/SpoIIIE domain-containing protein n=1 Tax=Streptomyces fradiae TaxID=1906 RepID=UPI002942CDAB|nr:FtsK/SpoIIIE domain-containing protein [Streptomyces fradiae]WOI59172.1 FtsK/SpoIIIE domain-containing protein [Streptomyces fradiae]